MLTRRARRSRRRQPPPASPAPSKQLVEHVRHRLGLLTRVARSARIRCPRRAVAGYGRLRFTATHRRLQNIDDTVYCARLRAAAHLALFLLLHDPDRRLHQIAHHRIDIPPDIPDFGKLGRFYLHERRVRQSRQPTRNLRLTDSRRPDHQNILRNHLVAQLGLQQLSPVAVPQRNRHRPLRRLLPDNIFVQFRDHFPRSQIVLHAQIIPSTPSALRVAFPGEALEKLLTLPGGSGSLLVVGGVRGRAAKHKSPRKTEPPPTPLPQRENLRRLSPKLSKRKKLL